MILDKQKQFNLTPHPTNTFLNDLLDFAKTKKQTTM